MIQSSTSDTSARLRYAAPQAKMLIVDDDRASRLSLAAMLAPERVNVIFATGAKDAYRRLPLIRPDVIVCDVVMCDMRGDDFFRCLKAHESWRYVPIIAVTQLDGAMMRAELLSAGADAVLAKPCSAVELRAQLSAALRIRRAHDELRYSGFDSFLLRAAV